MARLYDIVREIEDFEYEIDEDTGEILNLDDLDQLVMDRDVKIENLCLWVKNLESDAEAYKKEASNFQQKARSATNKAQSLRKYIQYILNGSKFKSDKVSVSYRKSEAVHCVDVTLVDDDYLNYKEPELNKSKVKSALKQGIEVRGCSLIERQNMQLK